MSDGGLLQVLEAAARGLRREIAFCCDAEGVLVWADETGRSLVGFEPGTSVYAYAPPGTEGKLRALIERSHGGGKGEQGGGPVVVDWEGCLVVRGQPATLSFRSARLPARPGLVTVVGDLAPQDFAALLAQVQDSMSELASLHRETDRQQRELARRNEELVRLNRELDDSARGMVALHAEVDEKNDSLRRLGEVKARVVTNISHEFRTPLNSIVGLSKMLLSRVDGELTEEQAKQIGFILTSAESLSELVNDMLDVSRLEAGKVALRPRRFHAAQTFAALRGMMRPLTREPEVKLEFDVEPNLPELDNDEGKISQILKNLLSNALKFTEQGEVRVSARRGEDDRVLFTVRDTGIGIAPEDQERIFDEFTQVDTPLHRRNKGTGLGLSISRRLAHILGGHISVESTPGVGSTFTLSVPIVHAEVQEMNALVAQAEVPDPTRSPVLVVEDDRQTLFLYERYLRSAGFQVIPARSTEDARRSLERVTPSAIVLDVMLEGESSWMFLSDLKTNPRTSHIPTLVVTVTNRQEKARALGADEFFVKPIDQDWLLRKLSSMARASGPISTVLVIDDDEVSRYLLRKMLHGTSYKLLEASDGHQGIRLAREAQPHVVFLDFVMPGMNAFDVIDELKIDPRTRNIPIIIHTSRNLAEDERKRLAAEAHSVLPKQSLNREVALARIRDALLKAGVAGGKEHERG